MPVNVQCSNLLSQTVEIVCAYVARNAIPASELPALINSAHMALQKSNQCDDKEGTIALPLIPAVPVKKSITADYIICLEDGKKLKTLKRRLAAKYNMSPDEYRTKWGLVKNYPMVCPSYAASRAEHAKVMRLGRRKQVSSGTPPLSVTDEAPSQAAPELENATET